MTAQGKDHPFTEPFPEIYSARFPQGTKERVLKVALNESLRTGYKVTAGAVVRRAVLEHLEREGQ